MKLIEVRDDGTGIADLDGARSEVNLTLIDNPCIGNYVIVHAGFAIERLDEEEANIRIKLFDEIGKTGSKAQTTKGTEPGSFAAFASLLCGLCVEISLLSFFFLCNSAFGIRNSAFFL